jgi:hypothetical protein
MKTVHLKVKKKAAADLSAAVAIGEELWLASDEINTLWRLQQNEEGDYEPSETVDLTKQLDLPAPADASQEIDIEGLDADSDGKHLWLIGSHSLKREAPKKKENGKENLAHLHEVKADGNRFIVARIPIKEGAAKAAQLDCTERRNDLSDALRADSYFQRFFADDSKDDDKKAIPGKDNGLDIEGLAVAGPNRLFIGLRGPVLRGWAAIFELQFDEKTTPAPEGKIAERLQLQQIHKTFVRLDGLGIRDLCFDGDDLLILTGPSMDLDWPVTIYRWVGARKASTEKERLVWQIGEDVIADDEQSADIALELATTSTTSEKGKDHAEGLTLLKQPDGSKALLLIYDSPAAWRLASEKGIAADVFDLLAASGPSGASAAAPASAAPLAATLSEEALLQLQHLREQVEDTLETLTHEPPTAAAPLAALPPDAAAPRLAIVVGHTKNATGAFGVPPINENEYPWNKELAATLLARATPAGIACKVFFRDGIGIAGAYRQVAEWNARASIELHFNSADGGGARGTETLHGLPAVSLPWARIVQAELVALYNRIDNTNRGAKLRRPNERGGESVNALQNIPSVLIEPFFGDNAADAALGHQKKSQQADALIAAFKKFVG